jgi:mannose-1-phosphate guanylyltransferase/mannose-6-phosphate isomerase
MEKIIPVILCGGSGKRLWPLSRSRKPKQFLSADGKHSLLQQTVKRALYCSECQPSDIVVVTSRNLEDLTRQHLNAIAPQAAHHLLVEQKTRNTGPAIAMATDYVSRQFGKEAVMWVLPSDHIIKDAKALKRYLKLALPAAHQGRIVTFGIKPQWPETGYGYIKTTASSIISDVKHFAEKPDLATAQEYMLSQHYYWNSGMFLAAADCLHHEFHKYCPSFMETEESVSFDKAVMEVTDKTSIIKCDMDWTDIGSWQTYWQFRKSHFGRKIRKAG